MRNFAVLSLMALPFVSMGQLWSQPENSPEGYYSDGYSTNGTQYPQCMADNFTLASASTISSIQFWGSSSNTVNKDLANFASFDFYVFDSTLAGAVYSANASTASLSPAATGKANSLGGLEYSMVFNTNISLAAGQYWLAIGSVNVQPHGDAFAWSYGGGQGDGQVEYNVGSAWTNYAGGQDEAFILNGQATPEPAPLVAFGFGALVLLRRRKR